MNTQEREAAQLDKRLDRVFADLVDLAMTGCDRDAQHLFADLQAHNLGVVLAHALLWVQEQLKVGPKGWVP